jgi:hypothetical protein
VSEQLTLAVHTYGAQRVKHPKTGQKVSAQKIGYSSAAAEVLLALYGERARNISSKNASYIYLQIDGEVVVRHGYMLLKVTADELARLEAITRRFHRSACYLWREHRWWELPNHRVGEYSEVVGRSGPDFNPTGYLAVSAGGIRAEKSQRSPNETPWWWLEGETYPHRELLKRHGARFSGKRKAWYLIAWELPEAVKALLQAPAQTPHPSTPNPILPVFGGGITGNERASNGDLIVRGDNGVFAIRTTWLNGDDEPYPVWVFDLPPNPTHDNRLAVLHDALKAVGARYSYSFYKWYFDGEEQVARLDALAEEVPFTNAPPPMSPQLVAMIEEVLAADDAVSLTAETSDPVEAEVPKIRVTKPAPFPAEGEVLNVVQRAIQEVKVTPQAVAHTPAGERGKRAQVRIPQTFVGELTGSITGSVWCYGYAVHEGVCVYVNMGGPRMAVEAIRAKLSKGDVVSVVPWDAPAIELTAGEGNSGMYHDYFANIPEAKFTSLILLHDMVIHPNYGGKATTFLLYVSEEQAVAQLYRHVSQLVKVPVFEAWASYLWQAGQHAMLVRKTRGEGGLLVYSIDLDVDSWTRLITGGLEQRIIQLPVAGNL